MDTTNNEDLLAQITEAREAGDLDHIAQMALSAFADDVGGDDLGEDLLAWVSQVVYEEDLTEAFDVLPKFVTHFPHSRQGVRVFLADSLAEKGEFDLATGEARTYLQDVARKGGLAQACEDPMIADWVLQALQLLGTGYCFAGARSYGQQIYTHGISLCEDQGWKLSFEQAIAQTERELAELDFREADFYWRTFLESGKWFDQVCRACDEMHMPGLKARMTALENAREEDPDFEMPEFEFMLDLAETRKASPAS